MKSKEDAVEISNIMKEIGELAGIETVCVITNMNEPIGRSIGNSLEIVEAVEALKGHMTEDIKEIILEIGSYIIKLDGKNNNIEENKQMILENISNGKAYSKFLELVDNQSGDISYIKDTDKFEKARYILPVIAQSTGFVEKLDGESVGKISVYLGAGRMKKEDGIDYAVGVVLEKKTADRVETGDILGVIHANDEEKGRQAVEDLQKAYTVVDYKVEKPKHILGVIE